MRYLVLDVNNEPTGLEYDNEADALARADGIMGGHVVPLGPVSVQLTGPQSLTIENLRVGFGDPRPSREVFAGFRPRFDLPVGWVVGWILYPNKQGVYFGIAPNGDASS